MEDLLIRLDLVMVHHRLWLATEVNIVMIVAITCISSIKNCIPQNSCNLQVIDLIAVSLNNVYF